MASTTLRSIFNSVSIARHVFARNSGTTCDEMYDDADDATDVAATSQGHGDKSVKPRGYRAIPHFVRHV